MNDEVHIISGGEGFAVVGERSTVERFLDSQDIAGTDFGSSSFWTALGLVGAGAQAGSMIQANAGRWVQLTEESAEALKRLQPVVKSASGLVIGVIRGSDGRFQKMLEFTTTASTILSPAAISSIGTLIAQMAMMKKLDKIAQHLTVIDEKVDDVLRSQKDAAISDMIGVDFVVEEALTIRARVGGVSEVTWSKVQATSTVIGRTQAYALRQLDGLADKLERIKDVDDLAKAAKTTEVKAREWLAVLAHCFRLQEGVAVLELDRVLGASPEDLDQHRLGLQAARQNRLEVISKSTEGLMSRMAAAAGRANKWVLLNPISSPSVVRSSNGVTTRVVEFHGLLGIDRGDQSVEARRWLGAVGDLKDRVVETGFDGLDAGRRFGSGTVSKARSVTNKVAVGVAERTQPRSSDGK